jgi:hypothetical protein
MHKFLNSLLLIFFLLLSLQKDRSESASNVHVHCKYSQYLWIESNIFSTYCIGKIKYGRDESNKIGGDKKHPNKYRKRKYIEHNYKK